MGIRLLVYYYYDFLERDQEAFMSDGLTWEEELVRLEEKAKKKTPPIPKKPKENPPKPQKQTKKEIQKLVEESEMSLIKELFEK